MRDIVRTNDPVLVSFIESLLREAGLHYHVADANMSIAEGSIGIFPRRVLVLDDDLETARQLLVDAGLAAELSRSPDTAAAPLPLPGRLRPI